MQKGKVAPWRGALASAGRAVGHWSRAVCRLVIASAVVTGFVLGLFGLLAQITACTALDLLTEEGRLDELFSIKADFVVLIGVGNAHLVCHVVGRAIEFDVTRGCLDLHAFLEFFDN